MDADETRRGSWEVSIARERDSAIWRAKLVNCGGGFVDWGLNCWANAFCERAKWGEFAFVVGGFSVVVGNGQWGVGNDERVSG